MKLDFRNVNTIWCSVIAATFVKLGLKSAIICPGSRSAPLTLAFAQNPDLETIPILDERSASFFALGIAKSAGIPVVLIGTSGTAGANFYPAIIEAKYSNVPLIILTADRPPELRNCHAGQTIDQIKLYGNYPNFYTELAMPSSEKEMLFYLRQNIIHAWEKSLFPNPGVVHLNLPFNEPLAPTLELEIKQLENTLLASNLFDNFCQKLPISQSYLTDANYWLKEWQNYSKGIIIAGIDHSYQPKKYCNAIAVLSELLQFPVLGEALSPVRNYADCNFNLITTYDLILRNAELEEKLIPDLVILIGELPTSKELRRWLNNIKAQTYIISNSFDNLDAIHSNSIHIRTTIENLITNLTISKTQDNLYLEEWLKIETKICQKIEQKMTTINNLFEGKVSWLLSQVLPKETPIFIANSMSVRYAEFFWQKNNLNITPYFNRGTNGIDGNLSTALGMAHHNQSSVMLTGDLTLLHDTNGFLINQYFQGSLTIILINNNGGGIFEMLPIAEFEPIFEEYFATPQNIDFAKICDTYGVEYHLIISWEKLAYLLHNLPEKGIRVLELKTNRQADSLWLKQNLSTFS